jgi:hypothetical protein
MSLPRDLRPRSDRSDTKTLVRLGGADLPLSEPPEAVPAPNPESAGDRSSVQLWFKGLREPVSARAEIRDGGLQLKADLPFLELDSTVGVATASGGTRLHGHIRHVGFAAGDDRRVPQLCVDVALSDVSALPERDPPSAVRARKVAALVEATAGERQGSGGRRVLGWIAALALGAAGGAGVALLWLAPRLQALEGPRDQAARVSVAREEAHVAAIPVRAPLVTVPDSPLAPDNADVEPAAVSLERYDLLAPRTAGDDEAALAAAETTWGVAVARAQAAAAATQLPQVSVQGAQTHVFVPMEGEGEGMRQYELTTPGIAVTLPRARALIPLVNHNVQRGIVRRVWLRREGQGVQVRVITRRTATRAAASYDETGLSIVLEP